MKRKGFTLIELLAVIVILAVIMVIAVPKILDVIESSREAAFENSKKLIKSAIKTQLTSSNIIDGNSFTKDDNNCYVFDFDNKNSNYQNLNVKNKENFSGSISYCDKQITYNDFSDGKNIVNGEDKVETPTTPVEPVVTRVDLKSKILGENVKLTNMSATADGDNIVFTSPYGEDGRINFTEDFSEYSFTKMYVKGHRNTGDSTYNHLFLYYFDLSGVENRAIWYPKAGEDFEYTLEIPEGTKIKTPSFSFCVGEVIVEELYLE